MVLKSEIVVSVPLRAVPMHCQRLGVAWEGSGPFDLSCTRNFTDDCPEQAIQTTPQKHQGQQRHRNAVSLTRTPCSVVVGARVSLGFTLAASLHQPCICPATHKALQPIRSITPKLLLFPNLRVIQPSSFA
eukprot:9391079-Alexandrium_andersonii.AAC.1